MIHTIKQTTSLKTGRVTFYVDGKKKPRSYVRFLEALAKTTDCFVNWCTPSHRYAEKTVRF